MSRRLTIFDNRAPNDDPRIVNIQNDISINDFLRLCQTKLSSFTNQQPPKKIYLKSGGAVDDMDALRDNDVVYISAGEPFCKAGLSPTAGSSSSSSSSSSSASKKGESNTVYSIAVMGPGSVGKSAMTLRYVQGVFVKDYDPTIEDAYRKPMVLDDGTPNRTTCVLDLLDTAGQEDYTALRSTWMRERDGFLLVYSVTDRGTFEALNSFYEQLSAMHEESMPPIVLVGNKSDLTSKRVIKWAEGKKLSETWQQCAFIETSAKSGENIELVFATLVREIRAKAAGAKVEEKPQRKRWCTIL